MKPEIDKELLEVTLKYLKPEEAKQMIKNRYIGKFSISLELINDQPSDALKILDGMLILDAKLDAVSACVDYTAISPKHFLPIAQGERPREYILEIDSTSGKVKALF